MIFPVIRQCIFVWSHLEQLHVSVVCKYLFDSLHRYSRLVHKLHTCLFVFFSSSPMSLMLVTEDGSWTTRKNWDWVCSVSVLKVAFIMSRVTSHSDIWGQSPAVPCLLCTDPGAALGRSNLPLDAPRMAQWGVGRRLIFSELCQFSQILIPRHSKFQLVSFLRPLDRTTNS